MNGEADFEESEDFLRPVCNYHWTTNNGEFYHVCPLTPDHTQPHQCYIADCEEVRPVS